MGHARQTFERRQLGLMLQRLRREAGKSQQQAALEIGKARTRIGELEAGQFTITVEHLAKLLDFYGVSGEERQVVLDLGALARARPKYRAYTDLLPGSFQRFADLEESATEINSYEYGLIPGLLQSLSYVRAIIDAGDGVWWPASHDEREKRIKFRLDRQANVLDASEPKDLRFVLTEDALRGIVGGPEVMREQRRHILETLENRPNVTVRVLANDVYDNPARGGGLTVLGFGDKAQPVGWSTSTFAPSTYFHQEQDTATLFRAFQRIMDLALDQKDSVRLVRRIDKES